MWICLSSLELVKGDMLTLIHQIKLTYYDLISASISRLEGV